MGRPRDGDPKSDRLLPIEDMVADGRDRFPVFRPGGPDTFRVIEQGTGYDRIAQVIVLPARDVLGALPGLPVSRRQIAELGPGEVRNDTAAIRIPTLLVYHGADRMWKE